MLRPLGFSLLFRQVWREVRGPCHSPGVFLRQAGVRTLGTEEASVPGGCSVSSIPFFPSVSAPTAARKAVARPVRFAFLSSRRKLQKVSNVLGPCPWPSEVRHLPSEVAASPEESEFPRSAVCGSWGSEASVEKQQPVSRSGPQALASG